MSAVVVPREVPTAAVAEDTILSDIINVFRVSISLFCGYPKSIISVESHINARQIK